MADADVGVCIVVSSVVGVAVVCTGVSFGVCIVVSVVGVVCAGVGVGVCIVVHDAVGESVVYVDVGCGMQLTNCVNSSCSLGAISAFLCSFKSFLLYYNVLESISNNIHSRLVSVCIPLIPVLWSSNSPLAVLCS